MSRTRRTSHGGAGPDARQELTASAESGVLRPDDVARVEDALPSAGTMQDVAATFDVLADPTRARIVYALGVAELCVSDVAAVVGLSINAASHQLQRLRDQGVVSYRREGRMAFYRLSDPRIRELVDEGVRQVREERGAEAA